MKKIYKIFVILIIIINCICKINKNNIEDDTINKEAMHEINQKLEIDENYLKAEFAFELSDKRHYFKYENSTLPSSKITAFQIYFDQFSILMVDYKVYCVNVENSTSDSDLINILNGLTDETSSCIEISRSYSYYDAIVKLDEKKYKLGIILISEVDYPFNGRIHFRISERFLGTDEQKPMEEETYSLVPFTINITKFREISKSKILFYSSTRFLHMYHVETNSPYPEKLFAGNILSIYTNPNMVRQKYHDANIMVLITSPFGFYSNSNLRETFKFEVQLFDSNYLLDYYVSSDSQGRPKNSPLLINMTECTNPYYVILNYNQKENSKTLVIDQIYGKISYLSVATKFTQSTWNEMLNKDMDRIDINTRQYILPEDSETHMDVYQIECILPLMLNFYYIEESFIHERMNYGDINIFTLKPFQNANIPFFSTVEAPNIVIEIFNPVDDPIVIVEAQSETIYKKNVLIDITPMTLNDGIKIKERGGLSDTRIIIKVGYPDRGWEDRGNIKYNKDYDIYLFEFPNDIRKYNYTLANLITSGTNSDDNVKYCFTTNIGGALKPSSENCYRVSNNNPYTLKAYNPLIMYKDYEYDEGLSYYITFKAVTNITFFKVDAIVETYDTTIRNYEGINNKITINSTGYYSSILTPPKNKDETIFIQVQVCDNENSIKAKVIKSLTGEVIVPETTIEKGKINEYMTFQNDLIDTEFLVTGKENVNVFLRMVGLPIIYIPSFNEKYQIYFDNTTNTLSIDSPISKTESMKYTVLVDKEGVISSKGLTLCSFVENSYSSLAKYWKTIVTDNKIASIQLNFNKAEIKPGEKFEAIVYIEQQTKSQMVFLSNIYTGTVGKIDIETIHEINETYILDNNYVYTTIKANKNDPGYYFQFLPSEILKVPIGAFSIELDQSATGSFTGVSCTFVDNETDAMSMIEAVERAIEDNTSYCIGSQSTVNSKRYNYIFKYEYKNENTPKRMIIKISNEKKNVEGNFNIYMKKDQGVTIEKTDYDILKEYGQDEDSKKSVIPYIVDVYTLRGDDESDYVSKVLFYSQYLEMQMYYIPEDSNKPIKLFCGNIALVYTNASLAQQKYHATTLVLISENLEGQEHPSIGDTFRFHTKMFKSNAQIEFFVSQNPEGRTLNFPLSLEMNTCTEDNNKLYYILNYNKPEPVRTLHLDMIFGKYLRARIAREINAENWNQLIEQSMSNIDNYQAELPKKSQHIDVIEIECNDTPLLLNAYYSYASYPYYNVKEGDIVVKELPSLSSFSFTIEKGSSPLFFYTISLFNPIESPDVTVRFSDGNEHYISDNSLSTGKLMFIPERITIINNSRTSTRFIFKIGYGVEANEDWHKEEDLNIKGTLYSKDNKFVYKFPDDDNNKRDFINVTFTVKSINEDDENVKFCYSTNLGLAIETSRENCFRTGRYIPYTLTFINPLIVGKNYKSDTENYYISFRPFDDDDNLKLEIKENTYTNLIRNYEGIHKELTLINGNAGTILSLPKEESLNVLVQINTCKIKENILEYKIYNAFTHQYYKNGKVYPEDLSGVYDIIPNGYLENEIKLEGISGATVFIKHAGLGKNYTPTVLKTYSVTFDENTNVAIITKPIYDEEFIFTVIVSKQYLQLLTQCDLAFNNKSIIGDYIATFTSVTSNVIIHYIDFSNINGYPYGTEFQLLVYAEQVNNSKMEFLYNVITGKVGEITGVEAINEFIEGETEYVTKTFKFNSNSNYLYYDFRKKPDGNIASLKVKTASSKVNKVGCVFTSSNASQEEMVNLVNRAVLEGTSVCLGEMKKENDGYVALINANYGENNRLVVQILYDLGKEQNEYLKDYEEDIIINIKITGTILGISEGKIGGPEKYAPIPYVVDLLKIRDSRPEYISKILFYSNTREMEMFYIDNSSFAPVSLFTGNIMLIYTNEELIRQKYHGATTMILLTDALSSTERIIIGEEFRFTVKYFNSDANIQYFLSSNPNGRPLNNPTTIEMTSCSQPYYYILNYNKAEEIRKLYIDTIFGERDTIKLATALNSDNWDNLISSMQPIDGDEIILESQLDTKNEYHFDVIEVKCKLPLLLNLFYVDPSAIKVDGLEVGDISVFSLEIASKQELTFKTGTYGTFVYSFDILKGNNQNPHIEIVYNGDQTLNINENGVYPKYSEIEYENIAVLNKDLSGSISTRIIFKYGYVIENNFQRIQNDIYTNQNNNNRTVNLFGYIYDNTDTKFNYTGVDFEVSTKEDNVKFCYSTSLGTYINPSLQNCYRVGKSNSYIISTLNPLVMYRNYIRNEDLYYYVGFRTVELNQNITITPILKPYDTTERNLEGVNNKIIIPYEGQYSTILTAPKNNEPYIFTHIHVCTKDKALTYKFLNAYNSSNLGFNGEIQPNSKYNFKSVYNTKLDTELKLESGNGVEVFVKHVGMNERYQPLINDIQISFNNNSRVLNWTQPIEGEEFKYTVYFDKIKTISRLGYTLCSIVDVSKLAHYNEIIISDNKNPRLIVPELGKDYEKFEVIIVAEQVNKGKITILSSVYDSNGDSSDDEDKDDDDKSDDDNNSNKSNNNINLIVVIIILSVVIIIGGISILIIYIKYKNKVEVSKKKKETSMALIQSAQNEKLVESQAQETNQIDP